MCCKKNEFPKKTQQKGGIQYLFLFKLLIISIAVLTTCITPDKPDKKKPQEVPSLKLPNRNTKKLNSSQKNDLEIETTHNIEIPQKKEEENSITSKITPLEDNEEISISSKPPIEDDEKNSITSIIPPLKDDEENSDTKTLEQERTSHGSTPKNDLWVKEWEEEENKLNSAFSTLMETVNNNLMAIETRYITSQNKIKTEIQKLHSGNHIEGIAQTTWHKFKLRTDQKYRKKYEGKLHELHILKGQAKGIDEVVKMLPKVKKEIKNLNDILKQFHYSGGDKNKFYKSSFILHKTFDSLNGLELFVTNLKNKNNKPTLAFEFMDRVSRYFNGAIIDIKVCEKLIKSQDSPLTEGDLGEIKGTTGEKIKKFITGLTDYINFIAGSCLRRIDVAEPSDKPKVIQEEKVLCQLYNNLAQWIALFIKNKTPDDYIDDNTKAKILKNTNKVKEILSKIP